MDEARSFLEVMDVLNARHRMYTCFFSYFSRNALAVGGESERLRDMIIQRAARIFRAYAIYIDCYFKFAIIICCG